ncbi:MBL fold metallo-hydrolase [Salarchaeum japonicum]|uniref:MBL fold metallo-hydrolase n=1 Tax=Salarchaeum japonicum TaxID=555573 RepID=A0AAV3T208_9EURY|nr:MBL fold metallo-hydrolase [Salarchaeum japonicum]
MFERISVPVATRAPTGATNAYLADGVLLDPAARSDALDRRVAAADIDHVAVTHTHEDHVGALAHYAAETGATVWARAGRAERFAAATGVTPDRTFREGDRVGPLTVLETPGHAPDHVAFAGGGELAIGDLAMAESSIFVGTRDGDMRAYYASLRRLLARDADALHPGHGHAIANPDERIADLLARRVRRERNVERAVREGARAIDDIVDAAYSRNVADVRDLATETVRAHLEKLDIEGRVRWYPADDRATPP